jgi:hypothetical protein
MKDVLRTWMFTRQHRMVSIAGVLANSGSMNTGGQAVRANHPETQLGYLPGLFALWNGFEIAFSIGRELDEIEMANVPSCRQ